MKELPVDVFLERVRDMPDIEAEEQLVLRMTESQLQYALITTERQRMVARGQTKSVEFRLLGQELAVLGNDTGRLSAALKEVRKRMDRVNWSKAVRAVFGDEGYEQVRVWMAVNR